MDIYNKLFSLSATENKMRLNIITLSFCKEQSDLESLFLEDYFNTYLNLFRVCHIIAVIFYAGFGIADFAFHDMEDISLFLKFGMVIPVFIVGFFFSLNKLYKEVWPYVHTFYVLLTGSGFLCLMAGKTPPLSYSYYVGIIICLIFGYTFIRARFLFASLGGIILFTAYIFLSRYLEIPRDPFYLNTLFLIIINILGMIVAYSMEISSRKNFYLRHLVQEEKAKVLEVNEALETLVDERTANLLQSNDQLKKEIIERKNLESRLIQAGKMQALGSLAGGIAHDFNNILYPIIGFAELSLEEIPPGHPIRDNLEDILSAAERAKELVSRILAFSRKSDYVKKPVKIQSIIREVNKLLRSTIPSTIEIRLELNESSREVLTDPSRIHQVLVNLATNAFQAMGEAGGILGISLDEIYISGAESGMHHAIRPGDYLKLKVSDTGRGMEPEVMEKIFDPYFTTKELGEGTGMGLSVVHGIIIEAGGAIFADSDPGKGTVFNIYFPLAH